MQGRISKFSGSNLLSGSENKRSAASRMDSSLTVNSNRNGVECDESGMCMDFEVVCFVGPLETTGDGLCSRQPPPDRQLQDGAISAG
jgi:hypothetical protein